MDISELSKKTNIASSKLRYYEKIGLIKSIARKGIRRVFKKDVTQSLSFIALLQSCGFSLNEISLMLQENNKFTVDRELFEMKIKDIDKQIELLKKSKKCIEHLNNCKEEDHFQCSNFQKLLKKALETKV